MKSAQSPVTRHQAKTLPAALIFDMDGVLVDSNPFHLQKMVDLLTEHQIAFVRDELPMQVLGQRNDTIFRHFFGPDITIERCHSLSEELEARFRQSFGPHARPLDGLTELLNECDRAGVPMAVASSAMRKNVEFVVEALGFGRYFYHLVSGDEVSHAKPDPEIYLKSAERLGLEPGSCVAFEDSFPGIEAAKRSGMKCVGLASTFPFEALREKSGADWVVRSFREVSLLKLRELFR